MESTSVSKSMHSGFASVAAFISMVFMLSACNSDNNNVNSPNDVISPSEDQVVGINGEWAGACQTDSESGPSRTIFQFNGAITTYEVVQYLDVACGTALYTGAFQGTFTEGGTQIIASGETVNLIDFNFLSATLTPESATAAAVWNQREECGRTDWSDGVSVDVEDCLWFITLPSTIYQIYFIEGTRLYLGSTGGGQDGGTVQTRPVLLDRSDPYTRQ